MQISRRSLLVSPLGRHLLSAASPRTRVDVKAGLWHLNDKVTYPGAKAEGLLMNVRMVNAVFEDLNGKTRPVGFDPARNTQTFLKQLPEYLAHGIRAFTISLQGGDPGYEEALNSGINPDGTLRQEYLDRVAGVIETCDRLGAVIILSCFYQRQARILRGEPAIRTAVVEVSGWVQKSGFRNVLLEITNEFGHSGYKHPLLRSASGQAELIRLAKRTAPGLLISTSGLGHAGMPAEVAAAADYLSPHLNSTKLEDIPRRIADLKKFGKPIVVNEDDKIGSDGAQSARACVEQGASWGYMAVRTNQHYPFRFAGANDDPAVYAMLQHVTTAGDYFPPPDAEGGWRALAPREIRSGARMDSGKLDAAFDFVQRTTKHGGLLVLRKGWLVYEKYFGLGHRDATPNLASCGKSFTSAALGILLQQRPEAFAEGLDQRVFTPDYMPAEAFPLSDPRMKEIKLGHLLCMTAGIRGNNPVYVDGKQQTIDPAGPDGSGACIDRVAFGKQDGVIQQRPYSTQSLWCSPGGGYSYATCSPHLVSVIVRRVGGSELEQFVGTNLAGPMGWGAWGYGYKNVKELTHTPGGGGIALRATDMLRFGYLLANGGRWKDRQVIPRDYVLQCGREAAYNPHFPYSLQFDVNTSGHQPDIPRDAFWKTGSGGHALGVVPSLGLVICKLGGRDGQYSPDDTGLKRSPASPDQVAGRNAWKSTVDAATAWPRTLAMVVRAVEPR